MWIAKNSVTGKEYGKKFKSIWDCQGFIDRNLKLLEYEMQRCFSLEQEFIFDIDNECEGGGLCELVNLHFDKFIKDMNNTDFANHIKIITQEAFKKGSTQTEIDNALEKYAKTYWHKNNIIRCYETTQKRWADGFDF